MINIDKNQKVYILCPANYATGGPEALYQLGSQLRKVGIDAFMHYVSYDKDKYSSPTHKEYERYNMPYMLDVENKKENWIIFPETFSVMLWEENYTELNKMIWWLSVTNYFISLDAQERELRGKKFFKLQKKLNMLPIPTIRRLRKMNVHHIAHSYFSVDFLRKKRIKTIGQISDYMKETFLKGKNYQKFKENIVTYNAIKNKGFFEGIIENTPEINWFPIQNMTNEQVVETLKKAKVYVDFGYHPGKERMPREACLMDCCLIIGKEGSAQYKEDMPILDEYHFDKEEKNIPKIIEKIKDCMLNYPERIKDFTSYKNVLLKEKETFEKAVESVFKLRDM